MLRARSAGIKEAPPDYMEQTRANIGPRSQLTLI
jgi:hypothetical protein